MKRAKLSVLREYKNFFITCARISVLSEYKNF